MSLSKLFTALAALSVLVISAGCSKDGSTASSFKVAVANGAASAKSAEGSSAPAAPITFTDASGTVFTFTNALISVRDIEFDTSSDANAPGETVTITGPFVFDAYNQTVTPDSTTFSPPAGTYNRVDIRLKDADAVDALVQAGDDLENNTLVASGTYALATGGGSTFKIILKFTEDLRIEPANGFVVSEDSGVDVVMKLKVNEWFYQTGTTNPIDLTTCFADIAAGNAIVINDADNNNCSGAADLEGVIKTNIKNNYDYSS